MGMLHPQRAPDCVGPGDGKCQFPMSRDCFVPCAQPGLCRDFPASPHLGSRAWLHLPTRCDRAVPGGGVGTSLLPPPIGSIAEMGCGQRRAGDGGAEQRDVGRSCGVWMQIQNGTCGFGQPVSSTRGFAWIKAAEIPPKRGRPRSRGREREEKAKCSKKVKASQTLRSFLGEEVGSARSASRSI